MKAVSPSELASKSVKELIKLKQTMQHELHNLKMKHMTRSLSQPHLLAVAKKNIARISTFLTRHFRGYDN